MSIVNNKNKAYRIKTDVTVEQIRKVADFYKNY